MSSDNRPHLSLASGEAGKRTRNAEAKRLKTQWNALHRLLQMYRKILEGYAELRGHPDRSAADIQNAVSAVYRSLFRSRRKFREKLRENVRKLLMTGYVVPDSWVKLPPAFCPYWSEAKVLNCGGLDSQANSLAAACEEMRVAELRLEAEIKAEPADVGDARPQIPAGSPQDVADDGRPFYKPAHFNKWGIGDELLRKNATDAKEYTEGRVRRVKQSPRKGSEGKQARYRYSEPDAQRCWPEKFAVAKKDPSEA